MIKINARKLSHHDIGREISYLGSNAGVIACYTQFKGHTEVIFEDGSRIELSPQEDVEYDDTVDVTLTCEELELLIETHPLMKKFRQERKIYEDSRLLDYGDAFGDKRPVEPHRIMILQSLLDKKKRNIHA